jgi:Fur family ferric uptake transcriptional regulator
VTAGRLALVDVLGRSRRPLTIQEILGRDATLAMSTAYRNLQVLESTGLVHRIVTADHARYELAEHLTEHHHHLICTACGTVEDVPASAALEASVAHAVDEVTRDTGFRTRHHRLDLVGLCRRCT